MIKHISISIAMSSVLISMSSFAHVKNGALIDGNNQAVSSTYEKCVKVGSGKFFSKCQEIKPKVVAAEPAPAPTPIVAPPSPKPEPAPVPVKIEKNISLAGDATFASNSADLTDAGQASLQQLVSDLSKVTVTGIRLVGHADSRGNDDYNQSLSEKRATAVKTYLVNNGVNSDIITASGRGESQPVASNDSREGRAKNRRVDVAISGVEISYK